MDRGNADQGNALMTDKDRLLQSWKPEIRAAYEADPRNAAAQAFDEYWRWVTTFLLTGAVGQRGWLDQVDAMLQRVGDEATVETLRARLLDLGKAIAADWSKDARRRRIHSTVFQGTPNLQTWGATLQRASTRDRGDGVAIERAVSQVEDDVSKALDR